MTTGRFRICLSIFSDDGAIRAVRRVAFRVIVGGLGYNGHFAISRRASLHGGFLFSASVIIPLKERVVDQFYDPLGWFGKGLNKLLNR